MLLSTLLTAAVASSPFRGQSVSSTNTANGVHSVVKQTANTQALNLPDWADAIGLQKASDPVRLSTPVQPDQFWEFIPIYHGSATPGSAVLIFETPCFKSVSVSATPVSANASTLTFRATGAKKMLCDDFYLITTTKSFHTETIRSISLSSTHTVDWSGFDAMESADVALNGFRVFRFSKGIPGDLSSLWETVLLFLEPQLFKGVTKAAAERNIKWLRDYASGALGEHFGEERSITDVIPSEDEVADGDVFCITRFDGLDPLINWGTGGNCGHNVMAIRINGELNLIESQSKSGYWPKDYVQRNKFADWIQMAKKADYNVLHLRLSAESRARFNATKVVAAFEETYEGLLYGFETLLWGWFDVGNDNFPPPLTIQLVTTLFSIIDPILTPVLGKTPSLWNNAIAQRLGVGSDGVSFGMSTRELLAIAQSRNLTMTDLIQMPERDEWIYPRSNDSCGRKAGCTGPSQVCNVFVCKMWKAGGLFSADFNCGEQVPLDTYQMDLFDKQPPLSDACKAADPMFTQYCQILGKYRLELPHFSTVKPFDHMREKCPSKAPNYTSRFSTNIDSSC